MSPDASALSPEAIRVVSAKFRRGTRSRLSTLNQHRYVQQHQAAFDELLAAKVITRRRKPGMASVFLYRGTDTSAVIWQTAGMAKLRAAVPPAGQAPANDRHDDAIEMRFVPDPSMSDAEYWHQLQKQRGPLVGKVLAATNMRERIGGFAAFKHRTDAQEAAAARFRSMYDSAHRGGVQAVDYRNVKVDASPSMANPDAGEIGMLSAVGEYKAAVSFLGLIRSSLVERIVVHDIPMRKIASGARARERAAQELRAALDDLALHFTGKPRKAA